MTGNGEVIRFNKLERLRLARLFRDKAAAERTRLNELGVKLTSLGVKEHHEGIAVGLELAAQLMEVQS